MGSDGEILFQRDLTIFLALENFVKPTNNSQVLKLTNYQKSGTQEYGTMGASQNRDCYAQESLSMTGQQQIISDYIA